MTVVRKILLISKHQFKRSLIHHRKIQTTQYRSNRNKLTRRKMKLLHLLKVDKRYTENRPTLHPQRMQILGQLRRKNLISNRQSWNQRKLSSLLSSLVCKAMCFISFVIVTCCYHLDRLNYFICHMISIIKICYYTYHMAYKKRYSLIA
jgi:hypothetical protein